MVICIFCFCPYRYTVLHMLPIDSINPTSNTSSGPFHPWKRNLVDLLRKMTRNNKLGSNTHNLSQIHMRSMNRGELRSASPHELRASGFHLPSHQEHPEPIEAALHFWKPSCESIVILDLYWEYPVFFFCSTFIKFFPVLFLFLCLLLRSPGIPLLAGQPPRQKRVPPDDQPLFSHVQYPPFSHLHNDDAILHCYFIHMRLSNTCN